MQKNYLSNKDETVRMFENNFLENLSRVHWMVPLFIYIPVIIYFFYNSFFYGIDFITVVFFFLSGIIVWSITEYLLHRFLFHHEFRSKFGKKIHFIFHGVHHDYPKDSRRLVMPPSVSIPLATIFYFLFDVFLGSINNLPFFAGFLTGYLFYDMTHYAIHHYNTKNKFWLKVKNHHMLHHYDDPNKGFGVSQPLWDILLRTNFMKDDRRT